jgi:hypothetical protein
MTTKKQPNPAHQAAVNITNEMLFGPETPGKPHKLDKKVYWRKGTPLWYQPGVMNDGEGTWFTASPNESGWWMPWDYVEPYQQERQQQ